MMVKTGLYFGSFNPIHNGHLMIANYLTAFSDLDELWFVVSPHNPLKPASELLNEKDRLLLCQEAIQGHPKLRVCDVEFSMPRPSYTIDTLSLLTKKYPDHIFTFICGMDSLAQIHRWKEYHKILDGYRIFVYPRKGYHQTLTHPNVYPIDAPEVEVSSTFIRQAVREGRDIRYFVHPTVWDAIKENDYYR